jgi:hypothetical protein
MEGAFAEWDLASLRNSDLMYIGMLLGIEVVGLKHHRVKQVQQGIIHFEVDMGDKGKGKGDKGDKGKGDKDIRPHISEFYDL